MGKLTLPAVTSKLPADLRNFIQRVRELISGAVSIDDLVNSGIATTDPSGNLVPTTGPQDFTTPPPPTGLSASGSITAIILEWDDPEDIGYTNNAYTEIWRSGTDNLSSAVKIGTADWIIYTDTVDPGSTYYYWIRFVSKANIVGPFNGTSGTLGVTNDDPAVVLAMLEAAITSTELHASLGSRIDLIDGSASTPGTIPYQIAQVQSQVDDLLAIPVYDNATAYIAGDTVKYNGWLYTAKQATTGNLPTNTTYWDKIGDYSSYGDALAALSSDVSTVTANLSAETTARTTLASQVRGSYTGTDIASVTTGLLYSEKTARTNADSALSSSISSLTAIVNSNAAAITNEKTARANADTALASSITTVQATANARNRTYRQSSAPSSGMVSGDLWIDSDDSNKTYRYNGATWVLTADTRIATNTVAIQTEATARASETGELYAQYTVKIDAGGMVSGYGLASTGPTGTGSVFEIRSNKIAFAAPEGVTGTSIVPFAVDTLTGRVAMDAAYIKTATINTAQIKNLAVTDAKMVSLAVSKITSGDFTGKYINIGTGGNIRCGQTAFNTGTGFWFGKGTDGYTRFSLGSSTGSGIDYSQSTGVLNIRGKINLYPDSKVDGVDLNAYFSGAIQDAVDSGIDTQNGGMIVRDTDLTKYAHFTGGDLTFYDYVGSGWVPYKSVTRTVTGVCSDGEIVNIGYFRNQPVVLISPFELSCYNANYSSQSQKFSISADNITKSANAWYFTANAKLKLSSATYNGAIPLAVDGNSGYASKLLVYDCSDPRIETIVSPVIFNTSTLSYFPINTRNVSVNIDVYRSFSVQRGYSHFYSTNVVTTISLYYYTNGSWKHVDYSINDKPGRGKTTNITLSCISDYDITQIYIKSTHYIYNNSWSCSNLSTSLPDMVTQRTIVKTVTYTLSSAVVSASGMASYIAIG